MGPCSVCVLAAIAIEIAAASSVAAATIQIERVAFFGRSPIALAPGKDMDVATMMKAAATK